MSVPHDERPVGLLGRSALHLSALVAATGALAGCSFMNYGGPALPDCISPPTASRTYGPYATSSIAPGAEVNWLRGVEISRPTANGSDGHNDLTFKGMIIGRQVDGGPWKYTDEITAEHVFVKTSPEGHTNVDVRFAAQPSQPSNSGICSIAPNEVTFSRRMTLNQAVTPFVVADFVSVLPTPGS